MTKIDEIFESIEKEQRISDDGRSLWYSFEWKEFASQLNKTSIDFLKWVNDNNFYLVADGRYYNDQESEYYTLQLLFDLYNSNIQKKWK